MRRLLALVPVAVLLAVLLMVPLPYFAIGPGPARDVEARIRVTGAEVFRSEGHFLLTTVTFQSATTFDAVRGWLDKDVDVVPERDFLPPGVTHDQELQFQLSQMDESKLAAASVALSRVTDYPRDHRPGTIVESVVAGTPADGTLFPGDLVVRADGQTIGDRQDLIDRIEATGVGRLLILDVRAAGRERRVELRPARVSGIDHPVIGVSLIENFPFPLTIQSGDIGGPSAGLMWAVGLTDLLTPGDLAGGRRIAGTGTIDLEGKVGPIGGIAQKLVAAAREGVDLFLVPRADYAAARRARSGLTLVPVGTYDEAIRYLASTCGGCGDPGSVATPTPTSPPSPPSPPPIPSSTP